jgi:hypothetical protein
MRSLGALIAILLAAQTAAAAESEEGYGKTHGLIPGVPLVFGPKISVAVPFPSVGAEVKFANLLGASFDYGLIPDITVSNVTVGIKGWHVDGRLYPFRGAFFLGAALGRRTFTGTETDTSTGFALTGTVTVDTTYLAPVFGWRWVYQSGLFLGVELGWEFVLSNSVQTVTPFLFPPSTLNDINDKANKYGNAGLPHVALFQVGFFL